MKKLKYYKLHNEVLDPHFATDGSACFDIHAYLDNPVTVYRMNNHKEKRSPETIQWTDIEELQLSIGPAERALIPTGLIFDIPEGYSVNHFLTDTNAWFIMTDVPNGFKHFTRTALETSMDGDFDTGNVRYKARERYSFGVSDYLGIFGSGSVS